MEDTLLIWLIHISFKMRVYTEQELWILPPIFFAEITLGKDLLTANMEGWLHQPITV